MEKPDIKKMEREKDIKGLIKLLKFTNDESVRKEAAFAIGKISDSNTMEYPNVKEEDGGVEELTIEQLIDSLKDDDWNVRKDSAKALAEIGKPAVEMLIKALNNQNWHIRWQAAETLGEIGDSIAVEPLIMTLTDENNGVRSNAMIALVKIGKKSIQPLINTLNCNDWSLRWQAADILGEIGDSSAVGPLISTLNDQNMWVRKTAASALGEIGDNRAVEPLKGILTNDDGELKAEALKALEKIQKN